MLKITQKPSRTGRTYALEGRISGPWVAELQRLCVTALDAGHILTLDLTHVSFIGRDGVALFKQLFPRKIILTGGSAFVMEQLKNTR